MGLIWVALVFAIAFLMVSTWRFYSFKDIDFRSRHPFQLVVVIGIVIALIAQLLASISCFSWRCSTCSPAFSRA